MEPLVRPLPLADQEPKPHITGAAVPPAHPLPARQVMPPSVIDPVGQKLPEGAVHRPEQSAVVSPDVLPKLPAGQLEHEVDAVREKVPEGHCTGAVAPPAHMNPASQFV